MFFIKTAFLCLKINFDLSNSAEPEENVCYRTNLGVPGPQRDSTYRYWYLQVSVLDCHIHTHRL